MGVNPDVKCIALPSFGTSVRPRGGSDYWAPQDLHISLSGMRPGEVTSVPLTTATETTRETAVTSLILLDPTDVGRDMQEVHTLPLEVEKELG